MGGGGGSFGGAASFTSKGVWESAVSSPIEVWGFATETFTLLVA